MFRIPATIEAAHVARETLRVVGQQLGVAPNLFRLMAVSPETLEGDLGPFIALGKGKSPSLAADH
jgi:hypothetical protein